MTHQEAFEAARAAANFNVHKRALEVWNYLEDYIERSVSGKLFGIAPYMFSVRKFDQDISGYTTSLVHLQRMGLLEIEPDGKREAIYIFHCEPVYTQPRNPCWPRKFVRLSISPSIRKMVMAEGKCAWCGSTDKLEVDHITPHSKGGSDELENLQCLCETCNRSKNNRHGLTRNR